MISPLATTFNINISAAFFVAALFLFIAQAKRGKEMGIRGYLIFLAVGNLLVSIAYFLRGLFILSILERLSSHAARNLSYVDAWVLPFSLTILVTAVILLAIRFCRKTKPTLTR